MTRLKFVGDMLEVNRIEVSKRELSLLRAHGLFHDSIDDLYNQLIGGYNISGYSFRNDLMKPSFHLYVDGVLSREFDNQFEHLGKDRYSEKYQRKSNGDYFLIYIQELDKATAQLSINKKFDLNKIELKVSELVQEDGSTYKVAMPIYDGVEPDMEISWTVKESFYLLKDNGAMQHINPQGQLIPFI